MKKSLSIMLAMIMIFTCLCAVLPITAFAAGGVGIGWGFYPAGSGSFSAATSGSLVDKNDAATIGSDLTPVVAIPSASTMKLVSYMSTNGMALNVADKSDRTIKPGGTLSIDYTGATTGNSTTGNFFPNSVSVLILSNDSAQNFLYYGRVADCSTLADGTATFTVPAALPQGTYKLRVFNEQVNGPLYTDFVSAPAVITLVVDDTAPTLVDGAVDRTSDADASVKFISDEAGTYYYQLDGTPPVNADALVTAGTNAITLTTTEQAIMLSSLSAGTHTVYVVAEDAAGNVSNLLTFTIPAYVSPPTEPTITGPTTMTLSEGYAATSTEEFITTGTAPVSVAKTFGDAKITWNDTTKKLDIATGLTNGSYPVELTATNSEGSVTLDFTLTVSAQNNQYTVLSPFDTFKGTGSIAAKIDAPVNKFTRLLVEGVALDSQHYTAAAGSTVIMLKESYLKTLADGSYALTAEFSDGSAALALTVKLDATVVRVIGVTLDKTNATLGVGKTMQLTASVSPTNATNTGVCYSSSDTSVATVDASGKVTGVKAGTTTITATTNDGGYTAICKVTVNSSGSPQTSDSGNMALWIGLVFGSILCVSGLLIRRKRRQAL